MKIGKVPNEVLERLIIKPLREHGVERKEVIVKPSVGEDCTAIDFGDEYCVMSTDPITGATEDIGKLAVHINANDIASSGGRAIGIMVTALLPPSITEAEIATIMHDIYTSANEVGIAVLGGHTEITDAVNKPIISCTVVGKTSNKKFISSGGAKVGDSVILTKYAGIEGTSIIASDCEDILIKSIGEETLKRAKALGKMLSVVKEGNIALELGAHAMHDVTEGGVLGACWEVAKCSGIGVEINCEAIPILEETRLICKEFNINPLRLISSGAMLIASDRGEELLVALKKEGINASIIGRFVENGMYVNENGVVSELTEPEVDELYKAVGR